MTRAAMGIMLSGAAAALLLAGGFALSDGAFATVAAKSAPDSATASSSVAQQAAGCAAGETVIFSCRLRNGKQVAVCVARDGQGARFAQYRYGAKGKTPELVWPSTPEQGRLSYASAIYSGGGEQQLHFARGNIGYTMFSRVVRTNFTEGEPNNPAISDGLVVTRSGRIIAAHACTGADLTPMQTGPAERYIPMDDDLFVDVSAVR